MEHKKLTYLGSVPTLSLTTCSYRAMANIHKHIRRWDLQWSGFLQPRSGANCPVPVDIMGGYFATDGAEISSIMETLIKIVAPALVKCLIIAWIKELGGKKRSIIPITQDSRKTE